MRIPGKGYLVISLLLLVGLFGFAVIFATNRAREKREAAVPRLSTHFNHGRSLAVAAGMAQAGGSFDVKQAVIASGGGRSSGGSFQAEDTIGQSLVGQSSGGSFSVSDGFWSESSVVQPSAPVISGLNPASVAAGGAAFSLTVNGSNFVNGSVVRVNGSDRQTTFVSAAQLTAQILAADIAAAGGAQVTVVNPGPGGGSSAAVTLTITPVTSGFTVSGRFTYSDGGRPVPGAVVTASAPGAPAIVSQPSAGSGQYVIQGVASGNYVLTPSKNGNANGITAFDAARILQRLAANDPFVGIQRKTADVDGNDIADASDARRIANFVVGRPDGGNAGKWVFDRDNRIAQVTGNLPDQDFQAGLVGDVTRNWLPDASLAITAVTPVTLRMNNTATGRDLDLPGVTIRGAGFARGLTLLVKFPDGGEMRLREPQILDVQSESFTALTVLNAPGLWAFRVINTDGQSSQMFVARIE